MISGPDHVQVNLRDAALACFVALVWGFNFVVISWGIDGVSPFLFVALRFVLVLFPAIFLVRRPDASLWQLAQIGLFMSLGQFSLVYAAIHMGLPAGLASLVLQAQVLFTIAFAALRLHERPTSQQLAGVGIGMVGLFVVAIGRSDNTPLAALVTCVGGALSWGWGNVVARKVGAKSGLGVTVWSSLVVPLPLLMLATAVEGPTEIASQLAHVGPRAIASTVFTSVVSSLVGYSIFNSLLARYPASTVIPFTLLVPPVGIVSAWLFLSETPGRFEIAGGIVLMIGVAVTLVRSRLSRAPRPAPVEPEAPEGRLQPQRTAR